MSEKGKPPIALLPRKTLERARSLRRDQTDAEQKLWRLLHSRQLENAKFRRQHPIGNFIVDFCCIRAKLIVELDGDQHAEAAQLAYDQRRSDLLRSRGFTVIRFWNHEVLQETEEAVERIYQALEEAKAAPSPSPLPQQSGRGAPERG